MKKHSIAKSLAVYEKILKNAWKTTWGHKELWLFGLLAGVAYSGSVLKRILDGAIQVNQAERLSFETIQESVSAVPYILSYGRALVNLPSGRLVITVIALLLSLAFLTYVFVLCQHILLTSIHRAAGKKKHLTIHQIFSARKSAHLLRLFAIDAIIALASIIVVAGSSIPLSILLTDTLFVNFLIYLAVYAVVLPVLFIINTVGMFTLIHAVRRDDGIDKAFSRALSVIYRHWLTAGEMSIILFLINIAAYVVFVPFIMLLTLAATPFFLAGIAAGSLLLTAFIGFAAFVLGVIVALGYFGAITVFNYAVWSELVERVERFPHWPVLEGIVRKFHA